MSNSVGTMGDNWDSLMGKQVGIVMPARDYRRDAELLVCTLTGANNNGVFIRPTKADKWELRFIPWGKISRIGLSKTTTQEHTYIDVDAKGAKTTATHTEIIYSS